MPERRREFFSTLNCSGKRGSSESSLDESAQSAAGFSGRDRKIARSFEPKPGGLQ
jgi:hypothetical protein